MSEQNLVFVPRRPGKPKPAADAIDEKRLREELEAACTACGGEPKNFVAAKGAFGSWLLQLRRNGAGQRIVWDGREGHLKLEQSGPHGGWEALRSGTVPSRDPAGFVAGLTALLESTDTTDSPDPPAGSRA